METYNRAEAIRCFGDEDIFQAAVGAFLEKIDAMLESVRPPVEERAFADVKEKAHWVKGGLVYLHAAPSAEAARQLENAADREDGEALLPAFQKLLSEVERLKRSLSSATV